MENRVIDFPFSTQYYLECEEIIWMKMELNVQKKIVHLIKLN